MDETDRSAEIGSPENAAPAGPDADGSGSGNRALLWGGIALFALIAVAVAWWLSGSTTVPMLVGLPADDAAAAIEAAGLVAGTVSSESTIAVPPGTVLGQSPAPDSAVRKGSSVEVVVAEMPVVEVPDVVGKRSSEAEADLAAEGLRVGEIAGANSADVPAGTVMSQSPEAGDETLVASEVALEISAGPREGVVPDVVGLSSPDAEDVLEAEGFAVSEAQRTDAEVAPGVVAEQAPEAGVVAEVGASVTIVVSTGPPAAAPSESMTPDEPSDEAPQPAPEPEPKPEPKPEPEPEQVEVPDLLGMRVLDALRELRASGLQHKIAWGPVEEGFLRVSEQDPGAGESVAPGSAVTLTIGLPSFLFDPQLPELPEQLPSAGGSPDASASADTTSP